jgi:hypothetical protein
MTISRQDAVNELERRAKEGQLSERGMELWQEVKRRQSLQPTEDTSISNARPTPQDDSIFRPVGIAATGFNKGLGSWVDMLNEGLKAIGLPMNDEPFMGTAFVDKYFGGAALKPQNTFEAVLARAGFEVGANAPLLAASTTVQAAAKAKQIAGSAPLLTAPETARGMVSLESIKNLPSAIAQELASISPSKLAALESSLAAGAGAGAEIVREVFPEGGKMAEFVGELLGSFTPSFVLGLTRKSIELVHGVSRSLLGFETESETRKRLSEKLKPAATESQIREGIERAERLEAEIPGVKLSAGEATKGGVVSDVQGAFERTSVPARAKAREQRGQNIEAVRNYFNATAPEGNTTRYAEALEKERQQNLDLLEIGVARTQARVDAVRGDISKRSANLLNNMEARMFAADQRIEQRLRVIGPQLSNAQRGEVIRSAYKDELAKFREQYKTEYQELDNLGVAELPVSGTLSKLADIKAQFPEQFQIISKLNPRAGRVLENLGRDWEFSQRLEKAADDLSIVGPSLDQRGGFTVTQEELGRGSTKSTIGVKSAYPNWYKSLANEKVAGTDNVLDRETIENAIDTLRNGTPHGLHQKTLDHVAAAIKSDSEFRNTPYYHPAMSDLRGTPSTDFRVLRQVRSDILALSRQARASNQGVQGYVLNEIAYAIDQDIDNLLPGASPFADHFPDHALRYRDVSQGYRQGKEVLLMGTANKLRQVNKYGDPTVDDDSIAGLFWKNETTVEHFQKAFQHRDEAKAALRDYALDRFMHSTTYRTPDGRLSVDTAAAEEWMKQHADKLKMFPDLEKVFKDTSKIQEEADVLRTQVEEFRRGKAGEERLRRRLEAERKPGDFTDRDIAAEESKVRLAQDLLDRTKLDWQASKASLFLKEKASVAGYRIATATDPLAEYEKARALVKNDPDAVAGLNKAIWEGLTEKLQPKIISMTGETNVGVFHRELQRWIAGHGKIMEKVLGTEGFKRIEHVSDALEAIARGGKDRSDTAINLQVGSALISTWISRAFAVVSGRVGHVFGVTERAATYLTKTFERMTAKQQEDILLESFFDPKVYQTLVYAGQYGPDNQLVKHQLRLHLLNLSEQNSEALNKDNP